MKNFYKILFILFILILISSCTSMQARKKEEVITGIKGMVIPVDEKGKEIALQDKDRIIVNIVKVNGTLNHSNSVTINPNSDGKFQTKLDSGNYSIEVFLEGFYVKSFKLVVEKGKIIDLGKIYIKKIETESASPIKEGGNTTTILNEGDVNIQPPN